MKKLLKIKEILNFRLIILIAFLVNFSFAKEDNCGCPFNICNDKIFREDFQRKEITLNEFNDWQQLYSDELVNFINSYSEIGKSQKILEKQAERRLTSQISKVIITEFEKNTKQINTEINRSLYDKTYEYTKTKLSNVFTIRVLEDDNNYRIHKFKCKFESCIERCKLSNNLKEFYYNNRKPLIESIIDNPENQNANQLFNILIEMYLYIHSFPYEKNSTIKIIDDQVKKYMFDYVQSKIKNNINISVDEITLTPFIYYDTNIDISFSDKTLHSYIDNFNLIAVHENGNSSWSNNILNIDPISNGKSSFKPGMILSTTKEQNINLYPDYISVINQIELESKGLYAITENSKKALSSFIKSLPIVSIKVISNESLRLKANFNNLKNNNINLINNYLNESDMELCKEDDSTCFEISFNENNSNIDVELATPDLSKKSKTQFIIKKNKISNFNSALDRLYNQLSLSEISYNFCDNIDIYINGNKSAFSSSKISVKGNTNIKLKYRNVTVLDTNMVIHQNKDLNNFSTLDILTEDGNKLCYKERDIDYEIFIENGGSHKKAKIFWNNKKYNYNDLPITMTENSLKTNTIKIKRDGYKKYFNSVSSDLFYRGLYPLPINLEPERNIFGQPAFKGFNSTYLSNLVLPGKGQFKYYKTSNFNKFKSILVGIAAYYFAGMSLSSFNEYENSNAAYTNYLNLYNSTTDSDLITEYRNQINLNSSMMKANKEDFIKYTSASGLLFLLNALEITFIHLSLEL